MASLTAGVGLGAAGFLLAEPGLAASGTLVAAVGLYVERFQARSLRRRRRAERMRNRHEVTELRRTIAQLRLDVGAFQRALLDTEAVLAARSLPLLTPVAEPASQSLPRVVPAPEPAPAEAPEPVRAEAPEPVRAETPQPARVEAPEPARAGVPEPVALPVGEGWVQTPERDAVDAAPLPVQRLSPFVAALSGSIPVVADEAPPRRRIFDTDGIPVLEPAPRDRLSVTTDALVYAALAELDDDEATRRLAYAGSEQAGPDHAEGAARDDERAVPVRPRHTA
jgi:hypothetical protein